jgi:transcriptional regulator with XRE-family HTH domain
MLFSDDGYVAGMKAGRPTQRPRTPFGERIAQARELAGITQLQLAHKLGVSQEVVAYWERKPVALRAEQLAALADGARTIGASVCTRKAAKEGVIAAVCAHEMRADRRQR